VEWTSSDHLPVNPCRPLASQAQVTATFGSGRQEIGEHGAPATGLSGVPAILADAGAGEIDGWIQSSMNSVRCSAPGRTNKSHLRRAPSLLLHAAN